MPAKSLFGGLKGMDAFGKVCHARPFKLDSARLQRSFMTYVDHGGR